MKTRNWRSRGNSSSRYAGVRDATSLDEAVCVARQINRRVNYERSLASTAAREAHLRSLMGLPAAPTATDQVAEGHPQRRIEKIRGRVRK
jgi:hypothetical protein